MRRYVTRNMIHTKSRPISFVSRPNTILTLYIVVLTEFTASDTVPTVLVICDIYSYGFRVIGRPTY